MPFVTLYIFALTDVYDEPVSQSNLCNCELWHVTRIYRTK